MTDARFPERWLVDRRFVRLSAEALRLYLFALMWAVSNRTDGSLEDADLLLLPHADVQCAAALERAGLWRRTEAGWLIVDFDATQTSADQLAAAENARLCARDKKRKQRARDPEPQAAVPRDVPGDSTGQARQGQARTGEPPTSTTTVERLIDDAWPEVREAGSPSPRTPAAMTPPTHLIDPEPRWKVSWCGDCSDEFNRQRFNAEDEPYDCPACHLLDSLVLA